jgi:hypothetical protein
VWNTALPGLQLWIANNALFGTRYAPVPVSCTTDGVHFKVLLRNLNMHASTVLLRNGRKMDGNNRSSRSWFGKNHT